MPGWHLLPRQRALHSLTRTAPFARAWGFLWPLAGVAGGAAALPCAEARAWGCLWPLAGIAGGAAVVPCAAAHGPQRVQEHKAALVN